jgi:hypothetical protein
VFEGDRPILHQSARQEALMITLAKRRIDMVDGRIVVSARWAMRGL